jgi:AAA domain
LYIHVILYIPQDYRRLNVAITRAKSTCILVGNADTLSRYTQHYDQHDRNSAYAHTFAELVQDAQHRNVIVSADDVYEKLKAHA